MKMLLQFAVLCTTLLMLDGCALTQPSTSTGVDRLYVLYCGEAKIPDVSPWTPGVSVGQSAVFSDNCYLIHHGKDWMLWDSGYPDSIADLPEGIAGPFNMRSYRTHTLVSQMAEIGVKPTEVSYVAFSHTHGDHVGNANLFTAATLYSSRPNTTPHSDPTRPSTDSSPGATKSCGTAKSSSWKGTTTCSAMAQ